MRADAMLEKGDLEGQAVWKRILWVVVLVGGLTAATAGLAAETDYPLYRAVVIYTPAENKPERTETFGRFKTLDDCLDHAHARRGAMVERNELYGGTAFCLYQEKEGAEAVLLGP